MSLCLLSVLALVAGLTFSSAATAQDEDVDLLAPDVDVDRDGRVGAVDVQRVINGALGIGQSDEFVRPGQALRMPVRRYVVATPRASLAVVEANTVDSLCCQTVGAAYNFPARDARLLARRGTMLILLLGPDLEGVWYDQACGVLGTQMVVEMLDPNSTQETWVEIGRRGARGRRCGPSIGKALIGLRHRFVEPGEYLLRAKVTTLAIPYNEAAPDVVDETDPCAVVAYDEVYVQVRVLDVAPTQEDVEWQDIPEPVSRLYVEPLESDAALLTGEPVQQQSRNGNKWVE